MTLGSVRDITVHKNILSGQQVTHREILKLHLKMMHIYNGMMLLICLTITIYGTLGTRTTLLSMQDGSGLKGDMDQKIHQHSKSSVSSGLILHRPSQWTRFLFKI